MGIRLIVVALALLFSATQAQQQPSATAVYESADAYQIYSLLLPREQSWRFAKGTLVVQQETVPSKLDGGGCFTPEANEKFKEAFSDYDIVNGKRWLLQRRFEIEKPYELVSEESIRAFTTKRDWEGFYKRYPGSGGVFTMSAVGFNESRTLAVVRTGSYCQGLCGSWSFHLLQKVDGHWKQVDGVRCFTAS
jgi:hypothetical protein